MPRLTNDLPFTLNAITTGRMIKAEEALGKGVVDKVMEGGGNFGRAQEEPSTTKSSPGQASGKGLGRLRDGYPKNL